MTRTEEYLDKLGAILRYLVRKAKSLKEQFHVPVV